MNNAQWQAFCCFRDAFKAKCAEWDAAFSDELMPLQRAAVTPETPPYPIETAVVYNRALDELTPQSRITYIVIGDNPGKDEQLSKNNRYLVGRSGKLAEGFFARNSELATDFRRNVIILNKTPVHTAKTAQLDTVADTGSERIRTLLAESQQWMAQATATLHRELYDAAVAANGGDVPRLWLVGYSELKGKGLFQRYRDELKAAYLLDDGETMHAAWNSVYVYRHFSMNQFSSDLKKKRTTIDGTPEPLQQALTRIGLQYKQMIFG